MLTFSYLPYALAEGIHLSGKGKLLKEVIHHNIIFMYYVSIDIRR